MLKSARNKAVKKSYQLRLQALEQVAVIERAQQAFLTREGKEAVTLDELIRSGDLLDPPKDPYGGEFFLDEIGKPRTTSKFASGKKKKR
jgi:hypothetical protein